MPGFETMGKMLVFMGLLLIFVPKLKVPFLGKLPGDIRIEREGSVSTSPSSPVSCLAFY